MRVFRGLSQSSPSATVLTIGNFDGVHLGHRALLARLCAVAGETGLPPAVLTFEPHPREFFAPESAPTRLSNLREKLELIAADGVELAFVARFNKAFASLTADQFIEDVLVKTLRVKLEYQVFQKKFWSYLVNSSFERVMVRTFSSTQQRWPISLASSLKKSAQMCALPNMPLWFTT